MKHPFVMLFLFIGVLSVGYLVALQYSSAYNNLGRASAEVMLTSIESDRKKLGHYPEKAEIESTKILWVLPGPKIRYVVKGADCSVHYEQWPLGPKAIKDCGGGDWYYEE